MKILSAFGAASLTLMMLSWQSGSCRSGEAGVMPEEQTQRVPTGTWGGDHIRLEVTETGAQIEYDCAHGTIEGPMRLDREGRFDLKGAHIRERPGPILLGEAPDSHPARYTGSIKGQTMTLTVNLTETTDTIGAFTLTHGSAGRVRKCR